MKYISRYRKFVSQVPVFVIIVSRTFLVHDLPQDF